MIFENFYEVFILNAKYIHFFCGYSKEKHYLCASNNKALC